MQQSARMCRKRGRIVLVGVTGLELSRADFYEKEITFQVSCSYGPGRYDPTYEEKGQDYPLGFVRWTEQRNFEAVLDLMAEQRLNTAALVSHRFPIAEAEQAYAVVAGDEPSLGVMLTYPVLDRSEPTVTARTIAIVRGAAEKTSPAPRSGAPSVGIFGSGNYATGVLIPALKRAGASLKTIASGTGLSAAHAGRKFGFEAATTDTESLLSDRSLDAIVIATRHDTHATLVAKALDAGKHVFVEKPLALDHAGIETVDAAYRAASGGGRTPILMVGFNRRFAPLVTRMQSLLATVREPRSIIITVNAGRIPKEHWSQSQDAGGGRIAGEACHFIDLARFFAGAPIVKHHIQPMRSETADTATLTLGFADGSTAAIHYFANGDRRFGKERIEVFTGGRVLALDNFRRLKGYGWPKSASKSAWKQDKGQEACAAAFLEAIASGKGAPIGYDEIIEVSRATVDIASAAA